MAKQKPRTEFEQRLHKAEQRAKRKIRRLEKRGIHTGGINPLANVSQMTTGQKRSYEKRLENFISRQTRYVAGYEGAPISMQTVKEIHAAEKHLNQQRAKQWKAVAGKNMLIQGASMTADAYRDSTRSYDVKTGTFKPNPKSPLFYTEEHHRDISMLKGERAAQEYIRKIKYAASKEYIDKKNDQLRENMVKVLRTLNDPSLIKRINSLSSEDLYELSARSTLIQMVFMNSGNDGVGVITGLIDSIHEQLNAFENSKQQKRNRKG